MSRIAVDAMGGDNAPIAVVSGSIQAAKKGVPLVLFGKKELLVRLFDSLLPDWEKELSVTIIDSADIITMETTSVRHMVKQKTSSMYLAIDALKNHTVAACVSAGNSAAVHTLANILLGRIPGILRPALGGILPSVNGSPIYCLDLGANTDCKAVYLEQFAYMADVYVKEMLGIAKPRIGLLSNGHEPYKGSLVVREAFANLKKSNLNFIGNIEARDVFDGHADIVVCDGFVGNIMLKTAQGTVKTLLNMLAHEAKNSLLSKFLLGISSPILKKVKSRLDYVKSGGALLLGVRKPVIVAHGSSNSHAIENAILFAHQLTNNNKLAQVNSHLEALFSDKLLFRPFFKFTMGEHNP
jgi:glycerol-3-phosphate acyltransferase PlsX